MKFTVYRDEWLRGCSGELYSDEGQRCCLGFLGNACGLTDKEMEPYGTPEAIPTGGWPVSILYRDWSGPQDTKLCDDMDLTDPERESQLIELFARDTKLCDDIINTNDDMDLTDPERESQLIELFARGGIEVTFEDTRPA